MQRRILAVCTAILIAAGGLLSGCKSNPVKQVYISEVMASNNGTLADNDGEYPDWIELHNPTDKEINLEGFGLTDNAKKKGKFEFPAITLAPGEYFVVYASGKNTVDLDKRIVHLPFAINSTKEDVFLYDSRGRELSHVAVENLGANKTCGMNEKGETVYFVSPTPGAANSETYTPVVIPPAEGQSEATVVINEYSTSSTVTYADEDGEFSSWVELYNYGTADVVLSDFTLTDDAADRTKWTFPEMLIPAGGYQLVFLSGKTKTYTPGGELHADFKLSGKEDKLFLYAADGKIVDSCPVYELTSNLTYGRTAADRDKWQFFPKATPGKANDGTGFDSIDSARYPKNKEVVISEMAAVNRGTIAASDGEYYDYIELYNPTGKPVSLKGYRLSDNPGRAQWHTLPDIELPADGYKLIWTGGEEDYYSTRNFHYYITMGLNRYGETLYLTDPDGVVVDSFVSGRLDETSSCGRVSMTDPIVYYFDRQTPGEVNPTVGLKGPAPTPVFTLETGYVESGAKVSILCPGATIHYTLDGSEPTAQSPVYDGAPISVTKNVTIRARAYMEGRLRSDDSAGSYLVGRKHDMPVMFLSTDASNFFDYNDGIWSDGPGYTEEFPHVGANYWKDREKPVHVQYMDENGQAQLEFNAGVKIFGQYSRACPQKSLSINMRDKYGVSEICYPFFKNATTNVFSELVLRNSGQDNDKAHLRDAFTAMVVKGQMDLDLMDYRPIVVYLNGEYYGIYDLREKINEDYAANRIGTDDVDMIKGNDNVMVGTYDNYKALLQYVNSHDLSKAENYDYVASQVDVDELINYWIVETFFSNTDTGNIKFYRPRTETGKWRWVLFDLDWALFPSTHYENWLEEIVNPRGHGVGKYFETDLMCGLMTNFTFRDKFMKAYGYHLKTTFATERMLEIFDQMVAELKNEMPYHIERWGTPSSVANWESQVATLRDIVSRQNGIMRQHLIETATNTTGHHQDYLPRYFGFTKEEVMKYLE